MPGATLSALGDHDSVAKTAFSPQARFSFPTHSINDGIFHVAKTHLGNEEIGSAYRHRAHGQHESGNAKPSTIIVAIVMMVVVIPVIVAIVIAMRAVMIIMIMMRKMLCPTMI
jgi:hypothetical protein